MTQKPITAVLFVDLDGTFILGNSFHLFMHSTWSEAGVLIRVSLLTAMTRRLLNQKSGRVAMKQRVLAIFERMPIEQQHKIVSQTMKKMREVISAPVQEFISEWRRTDQPVVLATAAPSCYSQPFAHDLGFTDWLATNSTQDLPWRELSGQAKADLCLTWLRQHRLSNETSITVMTDHTDDIPLLRRADAAVIQSSPETFARIVRELPQSMEVAHIDSVSAQEGGGYWLWMNDAPIGPYDAWDIHTILSKHRYALAYSGNGNWKRIRPGESLDGAVQRRNCPLSPSMKTRFAVTARRRWIRDRLRIFH